MLICNALVRTCKTRLSSETAVKRLNFNNTYRNAYVNIDFASYPNEFSCYFIDCNNLDVIN